jgi:hypothetical protein
MTPFDCEHKCEYCPAKTCEERTTDYDALLAHSVTKEYLASADNRYELIPATELDDDFTIME